MNAFAVPLSDRFDTLPREARSPRLLRRLNALLHHARRAPYYADRIPAEPLEHLDQLAEIPLLDRASFRDNAPPVATGLFTRPASECYVFASGGTTDRPRYVYRSHSENAINCKLLAKGLAAGGLERGHVVVNQLAAGELWAGMWVFDKALEYVGATILPVGSTADMEMVAQILGDFRADALISLPTQALSLAGYVAEKGVRLRVPRLVTGGEPLYPEARAQLTASLGVEVFQSAGYASNETGTIGYRCEASREGEFHLHEGAQHIEILAEDGPTEEPHVPGRIIVTNLYRTLMPVIRYDVGDLGCLLPDPCACGRRSRRFRLLGRDGSRVRLGTSFFYPSQFAEAVGRVPGLSLSFRLVIDNDGRRDLLGVEVEGTADAARLEHELSTIRDIAAEVRSGYLAPPSVRVVPRGALPRSRRTGKIAAIDDRRGRR